MTDLTITTWIVVALPTPFHASLYYQGDGEPRFLACEVDVASLVPLRDHCKAPRCRVLHEVDLTTDRRQRRDHP